MTHYRHEHVASYDRAHRHRRYAARIPHYDYDDYKRTVNERAKRQLIRAITRRGRNADAQPSSVDLVRGFLRLQNTEQKTSDVVQWALNKLGVQLADCAEVAK